uniref:Expressed protein n=1 Tax=uncultured bacterium contig00092 TaxID=1181563 RepID=A0A806K2H7_9BACT|nr:expressed protein [uncultured bacterium contig00092]
MSFIEHLAEASKEINNLSVTENGFAGYKTTGRAILDFFFKVASYKNNQELLVKDFEAVLAEEKLEIAIALSLYLRDVRGGQGQRASGRTVFHSLIDSGKLTAESIAKLISLLPEYGRWDDVLSFVNHSVAGAMAKDLITAQLLKDMESDNPSLLGKWLPSINTSSRASVKLAHIIRKTLGWNSEKYRKACVALRKKLAVVETKMSAREWESINYEHVPSVANIRYKNAFEKHDGERRKEYLEKLAKGEAKIHGAVNYPHDIIARIRMEQKPISDSEHILYDKLWKELPRLKMEDTLTVVDVSGSMESVVSGSTTAMDVSIALGLYTAESIKGEFHNKVVAFSERPVLCEVPESDIVDRWLAVKEIIWSMNTDMQAVFQLILKTAVDKKLRQEDLPRQLLVVTDMEFDRANDSNNGREPFQKDFGIMEKEYSDAGYVMPKLVFWNVSSRTCTIPAVKPEVTLISGFSPVTLELIANSVPIEQSILGVLGKPRYARGVQYVLN